MIECYTLKYKITRCIVSYDHDKNAKLNNYLKNINKLGRLKLNSQAFQSLLMAPYGGPITKCCFGYKTRIIITVS